MAFAFGLVAELEREMISKRTKEALRRRKANGKVRGKKSAGHIWSGKEKKIVSSLNQGHCKTKVARLTGMSVGSIHSFLEQK